jgi:hypothetical protein
VVLCVSGVINGKAPLPGTGGSPLSEPLVDV